ncbi:MAG TPA: YebC/PmpR family DNA-binding transcriptional regulator [Candidatus Onthoplasma faecigallinarum]|nr:YebC/PmpR family DNA-binding transcriptional regulator [Candidatus Onthoplasma faecigallinarum]
MSGHSKWNNIKGRKEKSDAERSKIFTKVGREIMVAVKEGGANIDSNSKLKMAIAKARQYNMPNDRINNIIKKNSEVDNSNFVEQTYEGYGVGGVAVVVKCFTDNKNRTSSDVRYAFDKYGGSLGSSGCVSYMFDNKGVIVVEKNEKFDADAAMELAIMQNAIDCEDDDIFTIYTEPSANSVNDMVSAFENAGYTILSSGVEMIPQNYVSLSASQRETFNKMLDKLNENDDVIDVIYNLEEEDGN